MRFHLYVVWFHHYVMWFHYVVFGSTLAMSLLCYVVNHSKTSFEKNCFSAWASTLNMGLINKVDMVCLSPVGYGV